MNSISDYSTTRKIKHEKPACFSTSQNGLLTLLKTPDSKDKIAEGGLRLQGKYKTSSDEMPLITVVTVVYNGAEFLEDTIKSVIGQTYDNVEYIIVDGGSTDGTLDIIRQYDYAIDYWASEPDTGIYNAMNKGITMACGDIIGLVNADDVMYAGTAQMVAEAFRREPEAAFTCGTVDLAHEDGSVFGCARALTLAELEQRLYQEMPCPHQAVYVRQALYRELGGFFTEYRLCADYDFLLRAFASRARFVYLSEPVGFFRMGGQSGGLATYMETRRVLRDHGCSRWHIESVFFASVSKLVLRLVLPNKVFRFLKRFRKQSKTTWL